MSQAPVHSVVKSSRIDKCAIIPMLTCLYVVILAPLVDFVATPYSEVYKINTDPGVLNKFIWPTLFAASIVLALVRRARLSRLTVPFHIVCLLAYVALAGASVLWAFNPQISFVRYAQQIMILTSIVLPIMLTSRTTDVMRGVFLCFAASALLSLAFVIFYTPPPTKIFGGYAGFYSSKNILGEFAGVVCLLSLHEMLYPRGRRALGVFIFAVGIALLFLSSSKTALALALVVPVLAKIALSISKRLNISLAAILLAIPAFYILLMAVGLNTSRISYILFGDPTFTGRTIIWDFAASEISKRPLLGWGYQSFWLAGPNAPSIVDAPGWVKNMPNSHSGYYDTMIELGYVGFALLLAFILSTVHAIGRIARRYPSRALLLFSLAIYIITYNFLESLWMRGAEILWIVFAIVAAETARYLQRRSDGAIARSREARSRGETSLTHSAREFHERSIRRNWGET